MRLQIFKSAKAGTEESRKQIAAAGSASRVYSSSDERPRCAIRSSYPALPSSLKLRRPSEFVARRSLGVDGCRASTSLPRTRCVTVVDGRAFAAPKGLRPRRRDKPGHDDG